MSLTENVVSVIPYLRFNQMSTLQISCLILLSTGSSFQISFLFCYIITDVFKTNIDMAVLLHDKLIFIAKKIKINLHVQLYIQK